MGLTNTKTTFNNLIAYTSSGLKVANYSEVRQAIVARFKEIYGQDIDLATTSADGVYVETLSLMMYNILQSCSQYYSQLDINTATGVYLDRLCALSNVYRKSATYSTCSVTLTLDSASTSSYTTKNITLLDKNSNTWAYTSTEDITFKPGVAQSIIVTCTKAGPIKAEPGWINKLVENNVVMSITQTKPAEIGSYAESDSELRARRNSSQGSNGSTILETLTGALMNLSGIKDAVVYNNDTTANITAKDKTSILPHSIYVVLRQYENVDTANALIGSTIYEKLTPGITTTQTTDSTYGISQKYEYTQNDLVIPIATSVVQNVYWKKAIHICPTITIKLNATNNYGSEDNSTSTIIAQNVIDYLNNLRLSSKIYLNDIWNVVSNSDPKFRGKSTYSITSITIDDSTNYDSTTQAYTLPDTFFNYSINNVDIEDNATTVTTSSEQLVEITLRGNVYITLTNLDKVMNTSSQSILAYCFNNSGQFAWVDSTIINNSTAVIHVINKYTSIVLVVFDGTITAKTASWDNYVKQTDNITLDLTKTEVEYDVSTLNWTNKASVSLSRMAALTGVNEGE